MLNTHHWDHISSLLPDTVPAKDLSPQRRRNARGASLQAEYEDGGPWLGEGTRITDHRSHYAMVNADKEP